MAAPATGALGLGLSVIATGVPGAEVVDGVPFTTFSATLLRLLFVQEVLLVGTAPADLAHRGTSAAAAGFVNFMGYMGAAGGDVVTGYFSAEQHGGWRVAIFIWAGWAFTGALVTGLLWNASAHRLTFLHRRVPRIIALVATAGVAALLLTGGALPVLGAAACAAAACLLATGVTRWAAAPALLVAVPGLIAIFLIHVVAKADPSWQRTVAVLGLGAAAIASLMILIEPQDDPCASS